MEAYLQAFINFEQNYWAKLLLVAKFAYNNTKNASTGYIFFKLNCGYYPHVSFKNNSKPCSQSKTADKLLTELQELMTVNRENFNHT